MKLIKKVSIVLVSIILISFCMPGIVNAGLGGWVGGKLYDALFSLIMGLGDIINWVVHGCVLDSFDKIIIEGADDIEIPIFKVSAEEIFSGDIGLFDVDFFNPMRTITSTAGKLRITVSMWYNRLRDIATVVMLSVLVYIGIRILISSTSSDKAKYKQMIMDWIIGLCLIFVMHYIMSFSNIIVKEIIKLVKSTNNSNGYKVSIYTGDQSKLEDALEEEGYTVKEGDKGEIEVEELQLESKEESGVDEYTVKFRTNLMGKIRVDAFNLRKDDNQNYGIYVIIYLVLIIYTVIFTFTYIKRVIYMTFLTMIAPLVAMTYPIDKINDGKAQAFNMWLKEYIFNLLIQPLHLLLYTILVSSAADLAGENPIYALVAIGFIIPAEKLMRKFFGFEKAQTPGSFAGAAAGTAMAMAGMNKLLSKRPRGGKDDSGRTGGSDSEKENSNVRTKNFDAEGEFANGLPSGENQDKDENPGIDTRDNNNNEDGASLPDSSEANNASYNNNDDNRIKDNSNNYEDDGNDNDFKPDEEDNNKNDYIEDRIANSIKGSSIYRGAQRVKNTIGNKAGSAKNWVNNRRVIKGIKNLPNKSRLAKAGSRAVSYYAHGMKNKISNKIKNGHLGRKAIRMAGGAILGATTATAGLAIGIASGDASKAFQYTAGAAFGGYKLGSGVTNEAVNALEVKGTKETFKQNYYGKEKYEEKQRNKQIKQRQKDLELQWKLEDKLGSKEKAKDYIQNELPTIMELGGDFDDNTIAAMAQMKEKDNIKTEEAVAAALMSDKYLDGKDSNNLGDKATTEFEKTLNRRGNEQGKRNGLEGEKLNKFSERFSEKSKSTINKLDKYRYK